MSRTRSGSVKSRIGNLASVKREATRRSIETLRPATGREEVMSRTSKPFSLKNSACLRLFALTGCLLLAAGCASTIVKKVWVDSARADTTLGKTLVMPAALSPVVANEVENEWARQLRGRGIEAEAISAVLPDERPLDEQSGLELARARGFDTLLVSRLIGVKKVDRDTSAYQVGVVETKLYDTGTGQPFWSARSDSYLVSTTGDRVHDPRTEEIRGFVETIIKEMSKSKVL